MRTNSLDDIEKDGPSDFAAPVFIVGTPRSGTTLLATMLSRHNDLACGPETFFFTKLGAKTESSLLRSWPDEAINWITSLKLEGEPIHKLFGVDKYAITDFLTTRRPQVKAILECLTETHARNQGAKRWVEKTPRHLLCLNELKKHFPEAKILRIVRDPRDVALSLAKVPWASDCLLANIHRCVSDFQASNVFAAENEDILTLRFEDLIEDSAQQLKTICRFVNVEYKDELLHTERSENGQLYSQKETWKNRVAQPLNKDRVFGWKKNFPVELQPAAEIMACDLLEEFGYECLLKPRRTIRVYPWTGKIVEQNRELILRAAKLDTRITSALWSSREQVATEFSYSMVPPLGSSLARRTYNLCKLGMKLISRAIVGKRVGYLDEVNAGPDDTSIECRLAKIMLNLFCMPTKIH